MHLHHTVRIRDEPAYLQIMAMCEHYDITMNDFLSALWIPLSECVKYTTRYDTNTQKPTIEINIGRIGI